MKKIAVVVEGPSDEFFWNKVLHREFAHRCRFKVMNKKNRSKVIQSAPQLAEVVRSAGYSALFFVVDLDDDACAAQVRERFAGDVCVSASATRQERVVHVCVARREFEAWLLADADAIRLALPNVNYECVAPTDNINAEKRLSELIRADRGAGAAFRKPAFARELAPHFEPARAVLWSASLAYFWDLMKAAVERTER